MIEDEGRATHAALNECELAYKRALFKSTPLVRCNQHQRKIKRLERPTCERRLKITDSQWEYGACGVEAVKFIPQDGENGFLFLYLGLESST